MKIKRSAFLLIFAVFFSCKKENIKLSFLDEYVVQDSLFFSNTIIGGISGVDYVSGNYYMVLDDEKKPCILVANINIDEESIKSINFEKVIHLDSTNKFYKDNALDLESIFVDKNTINLVSEGAILKKKDPSIFTIDTLGNFQKNIKIPSYFKATSNSKPKHNAVFESSSKSFDKQGFWVSMEGVLQSDGEEPTFHKTKSPVRITYFDNKKQQATKQFVYQLEKIDKPAKGKINLNGVTAILEYKKNNFFVVERTYQSGYGSSGNTIRIFRALVCENSTNTLHINSLKDKEYIPLKKTLLLDFKSIQNKLTDTIIDNIEGITFGPILPNGKKTLILVSDDNFQVYGKQLNQFILLEINEN